MLSAYVFFGFCLILGQLSVAKEIPLPIFMKDATADAKVKFTEFISRADLKPIQRRQLIDLLIATQPASVQQSYQKFNQLLQEHKNKFGISLETELEKSRQEFIKTHGHE